MQEYIDEINKCIDCRTCTLSCPIYNITQKEINAPYMRLQTAKRIFKKERISTEEFESIYNCPKCEKCEISCPSEIKHVKIIEKAREELFNQGYDLLKGHTELRSGILQQKNSVKADPASLLDYLPQHFEFDKSATTLYYAGCLPGYFLKSIANSSVILLQKCGIPFKVLENEICCGSPLMDLGDVENARKFFEENLKIFEMNAVDELIVSCSGCYRSFTEFYPQLVGKTPRVRHIVDVIANALKDGKIRFKQTEQDVIYHDPCHLGREFGMYDSPREILKTASKVVEFETNRQSADCCGADSAVRAGFRDLSVQVALKRIDQAIDKAAVLVTSCPFCTFNLNYACRKNNRNMRILYITEFLLNALK